MFASASSRIALPYSRTASLARSSAGLVEVEVERHHPPLDVEVLDHDLESPSSSSTEGQVRRSSSSSAAVKRATGSATSENSMRVGHPTDAVVVLHQQVLRLDVSRSTSFGGAISSRITLKT